MLSYKVVSGDFDAGLANGELDRPEINLDENLWVQYSIDGTNWTTARQHLAQGETQGGFVAYEDVIGENLVPDGTLIYIRFIARSNGTGTQYDHWAIDDINIYDPWGPSYHKVHENSTPRLGLSTEVATPSDQLNAGVAITASYNNAWVQHHIPRSDFQYSWITASVDSTVRNTGGQEELSVIQRLQGHAPASGYVSGAFRPGWNLPLDVIAHSGTHYLPAIRFLSASKGTMLAHNAGGTCNNVVGIQSEYVHDFDGGQNNNGSPIWHPFTRINMIIAEPITTGSSYSETVADGTTHTYNFVNFAGYEENDEILDGPDFSQGNSMMIPFRKSYFNDINISAAGRDCVLGNGFYPLQLLSKYNSQKNL